MHIMVKLILAEADLDLQASKFLIWITNHFLLLGAKLIEFISFDFSKKSCDSFLLIQA